MKQHPYRFAAAMVLTAAVFCTVSLGIGQTLGRYENTFSVNQVYSTAPAVLTSNFLSADGRTVLLCDWTVGTAPRVENVLFKTKYGIAEGALSCSSDSELIEAKTSEPQMSINQYGAVTLTLTPTEAAQQIQEETMVTVRVTWTPEHKQADPLWADFQVLLKPNPQQVTPEEVLPEDTPEENSGSAEEEAEVQPAEVVEEEESETPEFLATYPAQFAKEEYLVLQLQIPEGADAVTLTYQGGPFPENTGYAVGEATFTALADPMNITLAAQSGSIMTVLLDLSWTDEVLQETVTITAVAQAAGQQLASVDMTLDPTRTALGISTVSRTVVMEGKSQLELDIYGDQEGFTAKMEQLVSTKKGAEWEETEVLPFLIETEDDAHSVLTISNKQGLSPAGTYRLTFQREYEGVVLQNIELIIFLHY